MGRHSGGVTPYKALRHRLAGRSHGLRSGRLQQQVERLLRVRREMPVGVQHLAEFWQAADDQDGRVGQTGEIARQVANIYVAPVFIAS